MLLYEEGIRPVQAQEAGSPHWEADHQRRVVACQWFIRMYRPHAAREDTVLLPALRTLVSSKQVAALDARMEADVPRALGAEGFEKAVAVVASLAKTRGIYGLAPLTPCR